MRVRLGEGGSDPQPQAECLRLAIQGSEGALGVTNLWVGVILSHNGHADSPPSVQAKSKVKGEDCRGCQRPTSGNVIVIVIIVVIVIVIVIVIIVDSSFDIRFICHQCRFRLRKNMTSN